MPAKKIAVWFFKGGVGKTTTAVNVAAELSRPDYGGPNTRVALLDFDGQCNLTSLLIPAPHDPLDNENDFVGPLVADDQPGDNAEPRIWRDAPRDVEDDDLVAQYNESLTPNAYTALFPYMAGLQSQEAPDLHVLEGYQGRLLVLPGSNRLFDHDDGLASTDTRRPDSVNKLGAFSKLCQTLETRYNLDYIVVDLSPGATALSRTVIMSCDYLLSPVGADFFSLSSAQAMLTEVIPRWLTWHAEVVSQQNILRDGFGNPATSAIASQLHWFKSQPIKILPLLVCGYNIRGPKGALQDRPPRTPYITKTDSRWVHAIVRLLSPAPPPPPLRPIPQVVRNLFVPNTDAGGGRRMVIPFLKDIGSICSFSQEVSTPIITLEMDQLAGMPSAPFGHALQSCEDQLHYAKLKYRSLGWFIRWLHPADAGWGEAPCGGGGHGGGGGGGGPGGGRGGGGGSGGLQPAPPVAADAPLLGGARPAAAATAAPPGTPVTAAPALPAVALTPDTAAPGSGGNSAAAAAALAAAGFTPGAGGSGCPGVRPMSRLDKAGGPPGKRKRK